MFRKLSIKLAVIYGLIIIITIITVDAVLIFTYEKNQFDKNEDRVLSYGQILSNVSMAHMDDIFSLNRTIKDYSRSMEGRVLILNKERMVMADVFSNYIGTYIKNHEVLATLNNNEASLGYYKTQDDSIMMVTTPIIEEGQLEGVVLISASIKSLYKDIEDLRRQTIIISSIAGIIAILVSLHFGKRIAKPVEELIAASNRIMKGDLETKVAIKRKDEIGTLAETFNSMSEELYKVDTNRRRFISDVSHELKTPLASIKALIESLIDGDNPTAVYDEYLEDVNTEIDRLSSLVKSLLTVTRLEEVELIKAKMNIYGEVCNLYKLFKPRLDEKNITLINKCHKDLSIFADKDRVKEILINVIDNGIKYGNPDGFIEIKTEANATQVLLRISDNGIGISQKDLPFIFDNFYRVDKSRTRDTGGNGIGLFIVYKIVKLHGWEITVHSKVGRGTEFIIGI